MVIEAATLSKPSFAGLAGIGLLLSVYGHVVIEGVTLSKRFLADIAEIGFILAVYAYVLLEVFKRFVADIAEIRHKFGWAISFDSFFSSGGCRLLS
jgi:hypothetical protein